MHEISLLIVTVDGLYLRVFLFLFCTWSLRILWYTMKIWYTSCH